MKKIMLITTAILLMFGGMASAHGSQSGEKQSHSSGENQSQPNEEKRLKEYLPFEFD